MDHDIDAVDGRFDILDVVKVALQNLDVLFERFDVFVGKIFLVENPDEIVVLQLLSQVRSDKSPAACDQYPRFFTHIRSPKV